MKWVDIEFCYLMMSSVMFYGISMNLDLKQHRKENKVMIQEEDLLLKYLCMALPYRIAIKDDYGDITFLDYNDVHIQNYFEEILDGVIKPYLRPMSSMTERDCLSLSKELNLSIKARGGDIYFTHNEDNTLENWNKVNNWILKNHFDFMGLIPKGLAIEFNESNNPYE